MKRQLSWSVVLLTMWACQASAATHYVGTCGASSVHAATINSAIQAAAAGDTIKVCPGSYAEQLIISKSLTLEGVMSSGQGAVDVFIPSGITGLEYTTSTVTGNGLLPVIWVVGATVNISNIVAGDYGSGVSCGEVPGSYNVGFYYNGSSGTLNDVAANIACGAGVWLENASDVVVPTVKVENSVIWGDFFGILAAGGPHQTGTMPLLRATITGNQVEHYRYGIYLWDAGATVSNNTIVYPGFTINAVYVPTVGVSDAAPGALITGNRVVGEMIGIDMLGAYSTITSNHIQSDRVARVGIDMHCLTGNVSSNTLQIRGPGNQEGVDTSVGINGVPAGFTMINHFYNTATFQSASCD